MVILQSLRCLFTWQGLVSILPGKHGKNNKPRRIKMTKLGDKDRANLIERARAGENKKELAKEFNIHPTSVYYILNGKKKPKTVAKRKKKHTYSEIPMEMGLFTPPTEDKIVVVITTSKQLKVLLMELL